MLTAMIVNRIGNFFMLVGAFILMLFIFSIQAEEGGRAAYLLWGLGLFILGVILWWSGPKPPKQPVDRFRIFKRGKKTGQPGKGSERDRFRRDSRQPPNE